MKDNYDQLDMGTGKLPSGPNNQAPPISNLFLWNDSITDVLTLLDQIKAKTGKLAETVPVIHLTLQKFEEKQSFDWEAGSAMSSSDDNLEKGRSRPLKKRKASPEHHAQPVKIKMEPQARKSKSSLRTTSEALKVGTKRPRVALKVSTSFQC